MKQYWYFDSQMDLGGFDDAQRLLRALNAFANAKTWDETYQLLRLQHQLLLSKPAFALIEAMIVEYENSDDMRNALNWKQYLPLFCDAQKYGIAEAWKRFMLLQYKAGSAHDAIVCATTSQQLYKALQAYEVILQSDTLKLLLYETMVQERETNNISTVQHLKKLIKLVEAISKYNLATAWRQFSRLA